MLPQRNDDKNSDRGHDEYTNDAINLIANSRREEMYDEEFGQDMIHQAKLLLAFLEVEKLSCNSKVDNTQRDKAKIFLSKLYKNNDANEIVHSLEDQTTLQQIFEGSSKMFQQFYAQVELVKNREQILYLVYEKVLTMTREIYFYYAQDKEFIKKFDEDFMENMSNVKDTKFSFFKFSGAKLVNQFRNYAAFDKELGTNKDIKSVINSVDYEDIDAENIDEYKEKILNRCLETIEKHYSINITMEKQKMLTKMSGLTNYGQFIHIVHISIFKLRENRSPVEKIENLKLFAKVYPYLFKKCLILIEKRWGSIELCPDVGSLLNWVVNFFNKTQYIQQQIIDFDYIFKRGIINFNARNYQLASDDFIYVSEKYSEFLSGIELLIAHCQLNLGESLVCFARALKVLEKEPNCKAAHIYKILHFISCGQLESAENGYKLLNQIEYFTDPYFGKLDCEDSIRKIFIKKDTRLFFHHLETVSYIQIHHQKNSTRIRYKDLTLEKLKDICKKRFKNSKLEVVKDLELQSVIIETNEILPNREYSISEFGEDSYEIQPIIKLPFKIGDVIQEPVYENELENQTVVKRIKEENSNSFNLTTKLVNHSLRHVVKIISTHQDDLYMYVVMEKCHGNIEQHLKKKEFSLESIIQTVLDISQGAKELHTSNIVHLDIKIENGMLIDNRFVLIDFGESMDVEVEFNASLEDEEFEFNGETTRLIAAPEFYYVRHKILKSNVYSTDSWSIGITFFYLIVVFMIGDGSLLEFENEGGKEYFGVHVSKSGSHLEIHQRVNNIINSIEILKEIHKSQLIKIICGLLDKDLSKRMRVDDLIKYLEDFHY